MEDVDVTPDFWRGKRVFITGHTGFKGGWLSLWLHSMGAEVHGYALQPPTTPNFFGAVGLATGFKNSMIADIRDFDKLWTSMEIARPEIVFHLAAQPLVRHSYLQPAETYAVNVMGTVNVLEAVRKTSSVRAVINVTSDKCYENVEKPMGYRETEPMGGFDPYSSSKGCAELVTAAYRKSFLASAGVALASARAGNVIGGGDWAADRLVPDFLRASDAKETLTIRSPQATRPWQHVLEPLSGYITLAENLFNHGVSFSGPWNFGPSDEDTRSVQWVVEHLIQSLKGRGIEASWRFENVNQPHEAHILKLDSGKAKKELRWSPRWRLQTSLEKTLDWHEAWRKSKNMKVVSLEQIEVYKTSEKRSGDVAI